MQRRSHKPSNHKKPSYLIKFNSIVIDRNQPLGKGVYGSVYMGSVHETGQQIAVKVQSIDTTELRDACKKEIDVMTRLMNAKTMNTIKLHGYFTDKTTFTIAMAYAKNGSLHDWLDGDKLLPSQQIKIMRGTANGLAYMHDANIIHCDVKPENILLDEHFEPQLCDFGLSKRVGIDSMSDINGTALFYAPEILLYLISASSICSQNEKSDMYCFSLICWSIVAQTQFPYADVDSIDELAEMVAIKGQREIIPDEAKCPQKIAHLITLGWTHNPAKRPTAEQAFKTLKAVEEELAAAIVPTVTCSQ